MKHEYDGTKGVEIVFKGYQYHLDGELETCDEEYIAQLKKLKIPLTDSIDPVWKIEEKNDNITIYNGNHSYIYLKSEIKEYRFYNTYI